MNKNNKIKSGGFEHEPSLDCPKLSHENNTADLIRMVQRMRLRLDQVLMRLRIIDLKSLENDDADDYVIDPRYAVPVSRFGKAKPAVTFEMKDDIVHIDGEKTRVKRRKDGLDRMLEAGTIDQNAYEAGRIFQNEFARCGYDRVSSIDTSGMRGGFVGIEEILTRSSTARDYIYYIFRLLGGVHTPMAKAVYWHLGLVHNLDELSKLHGQTKHYWRGVLISALHFMGNDYQKMCRGERR